MTRTVRPYVPALRFGWLTRFYDPIVRALLREDHFKRLLVSQAGIRPGNHVLDLGCGTGTLAIMIKRACPDAHVVGLDPDPRVLGIARSKIAQAGLDIEVYQGTVTLPLFPSAFFDRVVSSLVFHHLAGDEKRRTLASVWKLLRPGGELHIADWGHAQNLLMRAAFLSVQLLDGFDNTADSVRGRLHPMIEDLGFESVVETDRRMTVCGTLSFYRAVRPGESS